MRSLRMLVLLAAAASPATLAAQQSDSTQADRDRMAMVAMKSDLRNLITAQEAFYADHAAYASSMQDGLKFQTSTGVTVRLTATQNNAWAAEARSSLLPNVACVVFINLPEKYHPKVGGKLIARNEGEPACGKLDGSTEN